MYFVVHNNRLYQFGLSYTPLTRYGLTVLILTIGVLFWYHALYCALLNSAASIHTKNNQLAKHRYALEEQKKLYTGNQKKLQLLSTTINDLITKHSTHRSMRDRMIFIVNQVSKNNLFLDGSCTIKNSNKNWYSKKTMAYDLKGNFSNIFLFFSSLSKAQQLVQCKQLIVEKINDDVLKMHCLIDFIELENTST